ncbi:hypothetical protein D3C87_1016520 [compost metagenome]
MSVTFTMEIRAVIEKRITFTELRWQGQRIMELNDLLTLNVHLLLQDQLILERSDTLLLGQEIMWRLGSIYGLQIYRCRECLSQEWDSQVLILEDLQNNRQANCMHVGFS